MHIERIHKMIECLTEKALCELEKGAENVDTCEMGQVVDMIKDLNEAEYKAVIVKAMKKADEEKEEYDKMLLRELKEEYGEEKLGTIYPDNIGDMESCIESLDAGEDPISGHWEDGCGNLCTLQGWGSGDDME